MTGLKNVGEYLTVIAEIGMIFLNEDRHFNDLSVIRNEEKKFRISPIFDNGLSFLADMKVDFPMVTDVCEAVSKVTAKPFSTDFETQTDIFEKMYGRKITVNADKSDI